MKEFEFDSLNGLMYKLSAEVSDLIKTQKQTENIQKIFNEIGKRIEKEDDDLSTLVESIENIRGML